MNIGELPISEAVREAMTSVQRTERGWGGHFICFYRCDFRRNTLLELGEQRIVVSTVGRMRVTDPSHGRNNYETIGHDRHYETMAFRAEMCGIYWDANVSREVCFSSPWAVSEITEDSDAEANAVHERVVAEVAAMMAAGTIEEHER